MVVSEKMDEELDQPTNPEQMNTAAAEEEEGDEEEADEGDGDGHEDDDDDDDDAEDQGKQKENDFPSESLKKKPPNQIYSPTKEEKRLVLEARHSLSIAETKKRRASVYSSESLFIPKELARKGTTLNTTLEKMAKNQEYCMRMLTFPVGSGRARYVAKQMKNGSKRLTKKQKPKADEEESKTKKDLPRSMPELDAAEGADVANGTNHLQSDDEMSILLLDMVNDLMETEQTDCTETQQNDPLSDNPQNQRTSVIKINRQLLEKEDETEQQNVLFRWHNPKCCDGEMKMRLMDRLEEMKTLPEITELQVNYSEVNNEKAPTTPETEQQMHQEEQQQRQRQPSRTENYNEQQQESSANETQPQEIEQLPVPPHLEQQQQQAVRTVVAETAGPMRHQQHVADVATSTNIPSTDALLRRQLMHHIVLDDNDSYQPSTNNNTSNNIINNSNNNALNLSKQNAYASDAAMHHWGQQQQSYQPQQQAQHRQTPPTSVHQPQQQHHHHHHSTLEQLQELKAMRQRLKFQEGEQLKKISKSLKKVYEERSMCERQHAEEKRQFLQKMTKSQKLEEKLQADREQLQRQHMAQFSLLEQRIAERQRQLLQSDFNFQRQQAYRQQLLMEQQHFIQQQQQDQLQQQLVQHQQQQQHLMQNQQQLTHQRLAQQQQQQHLAARQQQRNQQEQHHHHHHHHSPSFYTPPHGYEAYRPAPPPSYKPQPQGHPAPPTAAPQPPPPYAVPPAHPVVHHPSPSSSYQQRMQLFREPQIQNQPQLMEDQSNRLMPPPAIYHQQATTVAPPPPVSVPVPPPPRRSPEIQATCQPTIRTMRRRHTITHDHIIDHRTLPYVLPVSAAAAAPAPPPPPQSTINPHRYPSEVPASNQNINRTAITSLIQNYVSSFINDNLRPT